MRTQGGAQNLINGISRQPPEVRLVSQLAESVNQFPTVSRGLVPRNPAILSGSLPAAAAHAKEHLIDRDASEQYCVTVSPSGVTVHGLDGSAKVVNAPGGWGYLSSASREDYRVLTVQDYTFILNRKRVVQKSAVKTPALAKEGLVHVVQGDYFTEYKILLNGTVVAHYGTEGGPYDDSENARAAEVGARTSVIAYMLINGLAASFEWQVEPGFGGFGTEGASGYIPPRPPVYNHSTRQLPLVAQTHLKANLSATEWQITQIDNVIHVKNLLGNDFTLEVEAGSENRLRAHKGTTINYSDLPRKAPNGFSIRVAGSDDTDYDDYYVRFTRESGDTEGVWREVGAPDLEYLIDPATMPHVLVREADGTFTFKAATWDGREVGDDETNPWPSFVGQSVDGMSFDNERLGLHSKEALSQSRAKSPFNFWAESILAPLDTDPVDAAISYPEVSTISCVTSFAGQSLLFTQSAMFRLGKGETLTPKNVHYVPLVEGRLSSLVPPAAAGEVLYFVNDTPSGCFVNEARYDRNLENLMVQSINEHAHGYIPTGVDLMVTDGDLKVLAMSTPAEPGTVYLYKWLLIGGEKAQSAWQKWTITGSIRAMRIYGENLVIVVDHVTHREIVTINCHEAWLQMRGTTVFLDRQLPVTGSYDSSTELTTYDLPYASANGLVYITSEEHFGVIPPVVECAGGRISVDGDWSDHPAMFGEPYDSYGVLSPLIHRSQNQQGTYGNGLPGFETTVSSITFSCGVGAYLATALERDYRSPFERVLSAALNSTKTAKLGSLVMGTIRKPLSVQTRSDDFRLRFGNKGPFPYSVLALTWTGETRPLAY